MKITERQLRQVVKESVKKVLNESDEFNFDGESYEDRYYATRRHWNHALNNGMIPKGSNMEPSDEGICNQISYDAPMLYEKLRRMYDSVRKLTSNAAIKQENSRGAENVHGSGGEFVGMIGQISSTFEKLMGEVLGLSDAAQQEVYGKDSHGKWRMDYVVEDK